VQLLKPCANGAMPRANVYEGPGHYLRPHTHGSGGAAVLLGAAGNSSVLHHVHIGVFEVQVCLVCSEGPRGLLVETRAGSGPEDRVFAQTPAGVNAHFMTPVGEGCICAASVSTSNGS